MSYRVYSKFEKYVRPESLPLQSYISEFEKMIADLKRQKIDLPDAVLAYRLLNSANLSAEKVDLAMATVKELTYKEMSKTIGKIFSVRSNSTALANLGESSSIKIEPEECNFTYSENHGQRGGRNVSRGPSRFQRGYNRGNTYHPYRGNTSYNRPRYDGCYICSEKTHFARECPKKKGDNVQYFTQHGISTDSTPLPMDTDSQSMQNKDTYLRHC